MPLRETRRFKTRGFVVSFGDLMLPLVGVAAIGLLAVAGKNFFFSNFLEENQPVPMSIALPSAPGPSAPDTSRADASEELEPPLNSQVIVSDDSAVPNNLVLDIPRGNASEDAATVVSVIPVVPIAPAPAPVRNDAPQGADRADDVREEIVINTARPSAPANTRASRPAAPRPALQPQPQPQPNSNSNPRPAVSAPAQARPAQQTWMVQVGAYSTKGSADSVVRNLAQAGHTAAVVSGRLYRVLVNAGATRQDAVRLAARLEQAGYPGAFVVTPNP